MKKSALKKFLAIILAVTLTAALPLSVAAESESKIEYTCPKIDVYGFMANPVYVDPTDPDSQTAWPPSSTAITDTVKSAILPVLRLMFTHNWDRFADDAVPVVDKLFAPACSDYNGEVSNGSGVRFEYPAADTVKSDSLVKFEYDWRLDPIVIAGQLNDFINYVLECSGSDKVTLTCHSLGGVITLTYITLYGSEKLQSVVFNTTAIFGETYNGELFTNQIHVDSDAVVAFMRYAFDGNENEDTLNALFTVLDDIGLLPAVCNFANKAVEKIYDKAILSVVSLFANWPTIWAMIPDEFIDRAEAYVFDDVYKNAGIDCTRLRARVEDYNTRVRANKAQTLRDLAENVNVYVLARYGYSSIPITTSWNSMGDGTIDTKYNSFGATTAPYGEKLAVQPSKYVSPDGTVDASTCLLPEQTWFVKNLKHAELPGNMDDFIDKLLYHDGQATVDTFEEYPRYLVFDSVNGVLKIDNGEVEQPSGFEKFREFFVNIFARIPAKY